MCDTDNKKICGMCKQILSFEKFDVKIKVEGIKPKPGNFCYCCKECQMIRNQTNYKKRGSTCKKCNLNKSIIINPNTMKTRYVCILCQPTYFMSQKEKQRYYRRIYKEKKKENMMKLLKETIETPQDEINLTTTTTVQEETTLTIDNN